MNIIWTHFRNKIGNMFRSNQLRDLKKKSRSEEAKKDNWND